MSEATEQSLEELEASLRAEAAEADANDATLNDSTTPISENSGDSADPAKGANEDNDTDTTNKPSETGYEGNNDQDGEQNDVEDDKANASDNKGDTQNAESSSDKTAPAPKTKAEKEAERKDRSWKKLEEEKSKFLREKAEWEARKLQPQQQQQSPEDLANAFDKLATEFEEEGDFDKADEARNKAKQLRSNPNISANARVSANQNNANNPQFKVAWQANVERAMNDFPEMKDVNSEFGKTVQSLLRAPDMAQFFSERPDGAYVAAQLTHLKLTAQRVPTLEQKIAKLEEENKKLRQGMSLPDSGASSRTGTQRSFDSLSLKEQEDLLRTQAEREDASGRPAVY